MKHKTLLVSGCSFTANPNSWAYQLASTYNLDIINLACPGAGNNHIVWSTVSFLEKNNVDPETTLIGIMWSHPVRGDLVFEHNLEYKDQSVYKYKYDRYNRLVMLGDLMKKDEYTQRTAVSNAMMQGNKNKASISFRTWSLKTLLSSYLKDKGFNFFQTAFFNYLTESSLIKSLPDFQFHAKYQYLDDLNRIGLTHNIPNWIDLKDDEYLGEYAFYNQQLLLDMFHPSQTGHQAWTEKILIPNLEKMKIL